MPTFEIDELDHDATTKWKNNMPVPGTERKSLIGIEIDLIDKLGPMLQQEEHTVTNNT